MPIVSTEDVTFGHPEVTRWAYNALDCAVTAEVFEKIKEDFRNDEHNRWAVYEFMKEMQGPALDMTFRGIRVDPVWRNKERERIEAEIERQRKTLDKLAEAVWGRELNPNSPQQCKEFFYNALGLKPVRKAKAGKYSITTDDDAMDAISVYPRAMLFAAYVKSIRALKKDLAVVNTAIDPDGRFRAGYRIAGTETGRFSSAKNAFGTGANAQNITDKMRRMFIADTGMLLCYADLEQAESRIVGIMSGILFDDWSYYEACLSGDLHTQVCRMIWTNLGWTGDLKKDKKIAEQTAVGRHSYRDLAKRGGHGSNYAATPVTMAKHLGIETKVARAFQDAYFKAFPGIRLYQEWIKEKLRTDSYLTTPLGRTRYFFGRPNDSDTIRKAIAFIPQSSIADILNHGLLNLWHEAPRLGIELLAQVHDAVLFQFPENKPEVVEEAKRILTYEFEVDGKTFAIPVEAQIGRNWAHASPENPEGIK